MARVLKEDPDNEVLFATPLAAGARTTFSVLQRLPAGAHSRQPRGRPGRSAPTSSRRRLASLDLIRLSESVTRPGLQSTLQAGLVVTGLLRVRPVSTLAKGTRWSARQVALRPIDPLNPRPHALSRITNPFGPTAALHDLAIAGIRSA